MESFGKHTERKMVKTGVNEYGYPSYEFQEREVWLTPRQRRLLRNVLTAIGITLLPMKSQHDSDGQGAVSHEPIDEIVEVRPEQVRVGIEHFPEGTSLASETAGYVAMVRLQKDQVQFVDAAGSPVGGPVDFENFEVVRNGQPYLLTPGKLNEIGIPEEGIAGEWLQYVKQWQQEHFPEQEIVDLLHVNEDMMSALAEEDEPKLIAGLRDGSIDSYLDIINYYAQKPVRGAEEYSRLEYVRSHIQFEPVSEDRPVEVPMTIQNELRHLVLGLCAEESRFNAGLTSVSGAQGIFQMKPETATEHGGEDGEHISLKRQVEMAGSFIADIYRQLNIMISAEDWQKLRAQYIDEVSFEERLVVPLMINAYNAGPSRIATAVELYLMAMKGKQLPVGDELFTSIADYADSSGEKLSAYSTEARAYVPKVYAHAMVLNEQ